MEKLTKNDKIKLTTILCIIAGFLLFMLINISSEQKKKIPFDYNQDSSNESVFLGMIQDAKEKYIENTSQDVRIIANHRDSLIAEKMESDNYEVKNWTGLVHEINKDNNSFSISISLGYIPGSRNPVVVKNAMSSLMFKNTVFQNNQVFRDAYERNIILADSQLYNEVSKLKTGDRVSFSGNFTQTVYQREKRLEETSFTGSGKLDSPEYMFVFTHITPMH
ncbi:hypothetical protein ACMCO3_001502 [Salmonella enterica]|uniref:hypothetical protein n=1 Tax=Salmonella enterica TaxID=28901 RepID=UPI0009B0B669|nr:hypothetical protein [Salmonella enterica]EBR8060618.1 hypothetical protein [Salmonella enterica subsp. enterica serovar Soerenga]EDH6622029.1 hypothetical protein [Salmonella enterica subsp. enterica serovar Monschaui]EDP8616367.1 hypothetical protein [Salmonella enterica subsp. enterica]EDV9627112.1 hypothetical protein [Salmonella enterica subsp. enterica serovar Lagos]EAU0218138.1 hypothetical protein [Salmonella enterica]